MINGVHALIYAADADQVRRFFRDVLKLRTVDAGHGWLIFALPPAELGIHPSETGEVSHELYLMCTNIEQTVADLQRKGVECAPVREVGWGSLTVITIPGGGQLGLYEPHHPTAISPPATSRTRSGSKSSSRSPKRAAPKPKPKATKRKRPRG